MISQADQAADRGILGAAKYFQDSPPAIKKGAKTRDIGSRRQDYK
ncbi:hypothetical protein [Neorhodopirellula pilleata]|nr:hypothetical protein [Neorhodopirellula pilleata]